LFLFHSFCLRVFELTALVLNPPPPRIDVGENGSVWSLFLPLSLQSESQTQPCTTNQDNYLHYFCH